MRTSSWWTSSPFMIATASLQDIISIVEWTIANTVAVITIDCITNCVIASIDIDIIIG